MKYLIAVFATVCLLSGTANASHWGEYGQKEVEATNRLFDLCPQESIELLTKPYTRLISGEYVGGLTPIGVHTRYSFNFSQMMPAPSFRRTNWVLAITELVKSNWNPAPDAPGVTKEVTCKVSEVTEG